MRENNNKIRVYFASSLFSVISTLQLQVSSNKKSVLLLEGDIPNVHFLAKKISDLNIFYKVLIANIKNHNTLKYYLTSRATTDVSFINALSYSFVSIFKDLCRKLSSKLYLSLFLKIEWLLNIDEFYTSSVSKFCVCLSSYLLSKDQIKTVSFIEEGLRDYYSVSFINKFRKQLKNENLLLELYLNKPNISYLKVHEKELNVTVKEIPQASIQSLASIARDHFNNHKIADGSVIYFDEMILDVTRYQAWGTFKRKLLANSLKKARYDLWAYPYRIKLIKDLIAIAKKYNLPFKIRLHPRCTNYNNFANVVDKSLLCTSIENKENTPWEFILLANNLTHCKLLSTYSTSILSSLFLLGDKFQGKIIYLYKLAHEVSDETHNNKVAGEYILAKLQEEYPNKVFVPATLEELEQLLQD